MTKRYCSKCKYLEGVGWRSAGPYWVCTSPVPFDRGRDWYSDGKGVGVSGDDPEVKNKNNDCKDYKKKERLEW
jgi:hypothetical protein